MNNVVTYIRSYQFIANSTSYLNAAGFFRRFFSVPVISRIESIGGRWAGGGWGEAGAGGKPKVS